MKSTCRGFFSDPLCLNLNESHRIGFFLKRKGKDFKSQLKKIYSFKNHKKYLLSTNREVHQPSLLKITYTSTDRLISFKTKGYNPFFHQRQSCQCYEGISNTRSNSVEVFLGSNSWKCLKKLLIDLLNHRTFQTMIPVQSSTSSIANEKMSGC